MSSITPSPFSRLASAVVSGLVSIGTQTFAGVKTFAAAVVMSAGLSITGTIVGDGGRTSSAGSTIETLSESSWKMRRAAPALSINEGGGGSVQGYNGSYGWEVGPAFAQMYGPGALSTDVAVRLGASTADGSVHANAKILAIGTGLAGTFVEKVSIRKDGTATFQGAVRVNAGTVDHLSFNGSIVDIGGLTYPVRSASYWMAGGPTTAFYAYAGGAFSAVGSVKIWTENLGAGASDVALKLGTYLATAALHAGCKLVSIGANLGGTMEEKAFFVKDGTLEFTGAGVGVVMQSPNGTRWRLTISNAGAVVVAAA